MLRFLSIFVLIAAVFYFTPDSDSSTSRRAPVPAACVESTALSTKCKAGNAFVFYNGPSAHTVDLLNTLTMLKIKGTFIIESGPLTDWATVKKVINYGHSVGINVIRKYTNDILAVVNAEKAVWLANVGVVPKFVAYSNSVLVDSVNQILLANNYYPTMWSLDVNDFVNTEAQIKTLITPATQEIILINEFAQSNFTGATLTWFFNTTKSIFNDLSSCYGTTSKYWGNCTTPSSGTSSPPLSGSAKPSDSPTVYSPANKLSWFF